MLFKNDPRIRALVLGIPYDVPSYPEASQPAIPVLMVSGAIDPTAPTNSNALWEYGNITANVPKLLVEEVGQTHSSPITTIEGAKYIINWLNYWMIGNTTSYPIFFGSNVSADSGISRHWNANIG